MNKLSSIYIYSLGKGYENQNNGVQYSELKKELEYNLKVDFSFEFEQNFRYWFFDNFYNEEAEKLLIEYKNQGHRRLVKKLPFDDYINNRCFIKGDSIMKYIDYLELSNARKSSRKAQLIAFISIGIAISSIVIQVVSTKYFPPSIKVVIPNNWNSTTNSEFHDSTCCKFRQHEKNNSIRKVNNKLESYQQENDTSENTE